jgi:hypothetical protein
MTLSELFEGASKSVVAFISKLQVTPRGQPPLFPKIFGTGFFVGSDGVVVTNRHVVEAFDRIPRNPKTGESGLAAILFIPSEDYKSMHMLVTNLKRWTTLGSFTSTGNWYGQSIPDIGFVQLNIREVPFLRLATEDFYLRTGMAVCTVGYPMGDLPLIALGKLNQMTPFLRQGIISSVFPFTTAQPHGFTIDIMQQGGSSGSPIFCIGEPTVIGMMASSVLDWQAIKSETLTLAIAQNTNISIAEAAARIQDALDAFRREFPLDLSGVPTLQELHAQRRPGADSDTLTWDSWIPGREDHSS